MKQLEIIMIPVSDVQAAKAFYITLGFEVRLEAPDAHGGTWLQMGVPGSETTISLARFQGIIITTDDIRREIKRLTTEGIETGTIDDTPWGRFAWFKDPDGNSWCLHEKP